VFARTKLKLTDSVDNGRVTLAISTPESPYFNGFSANELVVGLVPGTGLPGQLATPVWDAARQAYLVSYNDASHSFSLQITADAEANDHDATDDDKVTMWYDYAPAYSGSEMASSSTVELDQELGGTDSYSGDGGTATYQITPGAIDEAALDDDAADKIVLQITEVSIGNVSNRGWVHGSGDYLYDIDLTAYDQNGNLIGTTDDKNYIKDYIIVSIPFDLEVVPPAGFESRAFVIRHAKTATQLLQGGGTIIPLADIMATDYLYGIVTVGFEACRSSASVRRRHPRCRGTAAAVVADVLSLRPPMDRRSKPMSPFYASSETFICCRRTWGRRLCGPITGIRHRLRTLLPKRRFLERQQGRRWPRW